MPTNGIANQNAELTKCTVTTTGCFHFEDYYPGDKFVDIIGLSFYNRGKATSDRKWLSPEEILYDPERNTLQRLKRMNKPMFIDEVGTTAVKYETYYEPARSKALYDTVREDKNYWLMHFKHLLFKEEKIIGFSYFNSDFTYGLNHPMTGEADRAVINLRNDKTYFGIFDLEKHAEKHYDKLLELFKTKKIIHQEKLYFVSAEEYPRIVLFGKLLAKYGSNDQQRAILTQQRKKIITEHAQITENQKTLILDSLQHTQELYVVAGN